MLLECAAQSDNDAGRGRGNGIGSDSGVSRVVGSVGSETCFQRSLGLVYFETASQVDVCSGSAVETKNNKYRTWVRTKRNVACFYTRTHKHVHAHKAITTTTATTTGEKAAASVFAFGFMTRQRSSQVVFFDLLVLFCESPNLRISNVWQNHRACKCC